MSEQLIDAVKAGDLESVRALVQGDADVNAMGDEGYTALIRAAGDGHMGMVRYLVEQGADVNAKGNDGKTALIRAAIGGHMDMVRYLLEQGADMSAIMNDDGYTALMWAAEGGYMYMVRCLVEQGADVNVVDANGKNAVYFAAKAGDVDIQRLLTSLLHAAPEAALSDLDVLEDHNSQSSTRWFITPFELSLQTRIDQGDAGIQFRAKWLDADVVVKLFIPDASMASFADEVKVWRQLRHPNVIKLYGACNVGHHFFVSEFASKGPLIDYLAARRRAGEECTPWTFLHEAALGLAYLHERNIVHGDLRGSNILIGSDGLARLSGFSLSNLTGKSVGSDVFGSTRWQSPERVKGGEASFASDVYSLGLCIVEALSGEIPWKSLHYWNFMECKESWNPASGARSYYAPGPLTDDVADLMSHMCTLDPTKRVTASVAAQMLKHQATQEQSERQTTQQPEPESDWSIDEYDMEGRLTDVWTKIQNAAPTYANNDLYRSMFEEVRAMYKEVVKADRPLKLLEQFRQLLVDIEYMTQPNSLQNRIQRLSATRPTGFNVTGIRHRLDGIWSVLKDSPSEFEAYTQRWREQQPDHPELFISEEDNKLLVLKETKAQEDWWRLRVLLRSEIDDHHDDYTSDQLSVIQKVHDDLVEHNKSDAVAAIPEWFLPWYELEVDKMSCVGSGGFGGVYRAKWLESEVVVKLLDQGDWSYLGNASSTSTSYSTLSTSKGDTDTPADLKEKKKERRQMFEHEVGVWFGLSHPHIVRLFGACHIGTLFFACEYALQGSLDEYLQEHPDELWQKLFEAALGVQYLHARGVIHGDLKCNNILVGGDGKAKVTDFGLSSDATELDKANSQVTGASQWVAPECLEHGPSKISTESDVYSLGMCVVEALRVVEMVTPNLDQPAQCRLPWGQLPNAAVKYHVIRSKLLPPRPQICADDEWELVQRMCRNDPSERLKISTVVDELERLAMAKASVGTEPSGKASVGEEEKKPLSMVETASSTRDLDENPQDVAPTATVVAASLQLRPIPTVIESMQACTRLKKDGNPNVLNQIFSLLWERMAHLLAVISDINDDVESLRELVERAKESTAALPEVKNTLIEFTESAMRGYELHRDLDKLMDAKFWRVGTEGDNIHEWQRRCREFLTARPI